MENFISKLESKEKINVKVVKLKNTVSKMQSSTDGFNIKLDIVEQKVSKIKEVDRKYLERSIKRKINRK